MVGRAVPELTTRESLERRKDAAVRLAAGSAMIGGSAVAMHDVKRRTGLKGPLHAIKDASKYGVKSRHGKYTAGWLGTRGVAAAGLPLAVGGASNLLSRRPKADRPLNVRRDVFEESVDRTLPDLPSKPQRDERTLKQKITFHAPIAGGAALGGMAGGKLAGRLVPKGRLRIATRAVGTGLGAAGGATAAVPITRAAVNIGSRGTREYDPHRGYQKVGKAVILPQKEQQAQQHRKHKAANLSLASAGLGVTALGLRAPAAVKYAAERSKRLAALKPVKRVASWEAKATPASWNVGVLGTGVGSAAALNAYRMGRTELKAEEGKVKKRSSVSKRLLVTGSRDWDDEAAVHGHLDRISSQHPDLEIIEGGARGADTHARAWAQKRGKKVTTYQADWKTHGRAAGPKRNQRMLDEGKPERVLAFSRDLENSKGTKDMVRRARRAGLPVEVVDKVRKDARAQRLMTGDWNNMSEDDFNHLARHLMRHGDYSGPVKGPLKPVKRRSTPVRYHASLDDYLAWNKKQNGRAKVRKDDMLRISGNRLRSEDVAKALMPRITPSTFRPRPIGFGGVRAGGIRRTPTGRLVTYRGSLG